MSLSQTIQSEFNYLPNGKAKSIQGLVPKYPAYVLKFNGICSVAIPCKDDIEFSERFNQCRIHAERMTIDGQERNWLLLTCEEPTLTVNFFNFAAYFVNPQDDGMARDTLYSDPQKWWAELSELIGNHVSKKMVYDIIGELLILNIKFSSDKTFEWTAINRGSNDIEASDNSVEVKSTIKRYDSLITISGQFQLKKDKMQLYFCRLEKSPTGYSIDDMVEILVNKGYKKKELETYLAMQELEKGVSARKDKYKILEIREYVIDSNFPRITEASFKGDKYPTHIKHIKYDVDLNGLPYTANTFYG